MKALRVWLLVVIAVLLPLRGVMAAALPCVDLAPGTASVAHHGHAHAHAHAMHVDAGHDVAMHPAASEAHSHCGTAKCHLCAACCTVPPMMASFATGIAALDLPSATFPAPAASATSFVPEGQERPPRST